MSEQNGRAIAQSCLHMDVEVVDIVEDDPGPSNQEGWHNVEAECRDCGAELECTIDWGALQAEVVEVNDGA